MGQIVIGDMIQPRFGYVMPFLPNLRRQLRNPNILYHVANPSFSVDDILRDDCDGSNTRNHPIFLQFPDSIRIRLYYDDLELTEAIGSYTMKIGE